MIRSSSCRLSFSIVFPCSLNLLFRSLAAFSSSLHRITAVPAQLTESISSSSSLYRRSSPKRLVIPDMLLRIMTRMVSSVILVVISKVSRESVIAMPPLIGSWRRIDCNSASHWFSSRWLEHARKSLASDCLTVLRQSSMSWGPLISWLNAHGTIHMGSPPLSQATLGPAVMVH